MAIGGSLQKWMDPNKVHTRKDRGGKGFPDPLNIFEGSQPLPEKSAAELAAEEEARKAELRRRLDILFGIAPPARPEATVPEPIPGQGILAKSFNSARPELEAAAAKATAGYEGEKSEAENAAAQFAAERTRLSDALQAQYTDELGRDFTDAQRATKFGLARHGLLGGSVDVDKNARLMSDRDTGSTRIGEAVRRAAGQLEGMREQERLNAMNLINAGAGDDAIASAQRGISTALQNASNARREDLFTDLFAGTANAFAANNEDARERALMARYGRGLTTFFPQSGGGATITGNY